MLKTAYTKIKAFVCEHSAICVVLLILVTAILVYNSTKPTTIIDTVTIDTNTELQKYADSLYEAHYRDSVYYAQSIYTLDSQSACYKRKVDSLILAIELNQKHSKQYVKTVYKDSIKEVYIENDELSLQYQSTIKTLEDSLAKRDVHIVHDTIFIEGVNTVDTVVQQVVKYDSVFVQRVDSTHTQTGNAKRVFLYAEGAIDIQDGVGIYGEAGARVNIIGPVYGKAAVTYDGEIGGKVGIGAELGF